mmetsp:Transcript_24167/g.78768  ORF Transcript_24167/g.78768 Transcript_24167/m.78768 type:complete len:200 (-) Transcript_24167:938-1537(-)
MRATRLSLRLLTILLFCVRKERLACQQESSSSVIARVTWSYMLDVLFAGHQRDQLLVVQRWLQHVCAQPAEPPRASNAARAQGAGSSYPPLCDDRRAGGRRHFLLLSVSSCSGCRTCEGRSAWRSGGSLVEGPDEAREPSRRVAMTAGEQLLQGQEVAEAARHVLFSLSLHHHQQATCDCVEADSDVPTGQGKELQPLQ